MFASYFKLIALAFALLCLTNAGAWRLPASFPKTAIKTSKSLVAAVLLATYTGSALESQHFDVAPVMQAHAADSVFVGNYNDPNHPGCLRKITVKGKEVSILGSDSVDGSKQWLLKANEDYPGTIFVDFSPKGGPANLLGVYDETKDAIKWPDGNSWTKIVKKST